MDINIDGISIYYEQYGAGPDVLVLHGWGASIQTMRPVIDALKSSYRITALDFPGCGGSGMPPNTFGVQDYADLTLHMLDRLGIKKTHVICHSFGGRVAILLAAGHPELFDKIVFTDAAGLRKPRTMKQNMRVHVFKMFKRINKGRVVKGILRVMGIDVESRVKNAGSADYRALSEDMRKVFVRIVNQDLKEHLHLIKSPSLLIWGENDLDTPVCFGETMEKEIPDAGLVVLKGAGHYSFLDSLPQYINIVRTFFGG